MNFMKPQKGILVVLIVLTGNISLAFSSLAANQSFKTTFDCAKVTSKIEKTICEVKELADADLEMGALYKSLLPGVPEGEKNQLKHEQLDWIKDRNKSCSNSANIINCIKDSYSNRINALKKREAALPSVSPPAPGTGYPVQWYEGFELHIYYKDGKPPKTLDDVKRLFQGKWEYPVKAYGDGDAVYSVGSCGDFFKAKEGKFYPVSNLHRGPYSFAGIYCIAAKLILDGKPAKKSFIENLNVDGTIAKYLPADIEYIISDEQPRHTSGSWAEVEKVKAQSVTSEEIDFTSSDADHFVRKIAVGDFNGDGLQDILLMVGHHVKEGTHFENSLYLMTRSGSNDLLKTIKKYTALEDD